MKAWHFLSATGCLRDGSFPPDNGQSLVHRGDLEICVSGLHASLKLSDALKYSPGPVLCRVKVEKEWVICNDKLVARNRTILWRIDATDVLLKFSRLCALDVLHLWEPPAIVVRFLKSGDPNLRAAARAAAWAAAKAAECDAAWAAARAAAGVAAKADAIAAARAAGCDAAWAAAVSFDVTPAELADAYERRLKRLVYRARKATTKLEEVEEQ